MPHSIQTHAEELLALPDVEGEGALIPDVLSRCIYAILEVSVVQAAEISEVRWLQLATVCFFTVIL